MNPSLEHLQRLRTADLIQILSLFPPRSAILEIGAGMGWQAELLAGKGFAVTAIDIPGGVEAQQKAYPVVEYDGRSIPFPERSFDVVFSSNVLEHIPHLAAFQTEIARVLKPGGKAIHILPSACWRFWTTMAYYPYLIKRIFTRQTPVIAAAGEEAKPARRTLPQRLFPPRHGERGNFFSEMYWFSRRCWQRHFQQHGWRIATYQPSRLFYTGYEVLHLHMNLPARRRLSFVCGSSCHVFCLDRPASSS